MLEVIYVTRHGFRSNWTTDPHTGQTSATILSPTNIPADPPLSSHGIDQARELAAHLITVSPPPQRIYSSPFYRCLQTIDPAADALSISHIYTENGIGEWYGRARFEHPSPADVQLLHKFFPKVDTTYAPVIVPSTKGESVAEIHDRVAYCLARIIEVVDNENQEILKSGTGEPIKAILLCAHAATNICIGRVLTGDQTLDVHTGTCSLSAYQRKPVPPVVHKPLPLPSDAEPVPRVDWKGGKGVGGGWVCKVNGDCGFLKDGEERNWWFSGEEDWDYVVKKTDGEVQVGVDAESVAEEKEEEEQEQKYDGKVEEVAKI